MRGRPPGWLVFLTRVPGFTRLMRAMARRDPTLQGKHAMVARPMEGQREWAVSSGLLRTIPRPDRGFGVGFAFGVSAGVLIGVPTGIWLLLVFQGRA